MNCREFRKWLVNRDPRKQEMDREAAKHLTACSRCEALHGLDLHLESALNRSLKKAPTPESLVRRLAVDFAPAEKKRFLDRFDLKRFFRIPLRVMAPIGAAALLLLLLLNPLNRGGVGGTPLEEIARLTVQDHMNNLTMAFNVSEVDDIPGWFQERLGYAVEPPDLSREGYRLSGGRQCHLGPCDAAYLLYEKEGKRASLFILPASTLDHALKKGETCKRFLGDCEVKFWQESEKLFALVI